MLELFLYITLDNLLYALRNLFLARVTLPCSGIHGTWRRWNTDVLHVDKYVIQVDIEVADVDLGLILFLLLILVVLARHYGFDFEIKVVDVGWRCYRLG